MTQTVSSTSALAERYASALFDLALDARNIASVEKDLERFEALIGGSQDLRRLMASPVFSKDDQFAAINDVLTKAKISGLVGSFIRVVASNRRLFAVPGMIARFREMVAEHKGEANASVVSAQKLTAAQVKLLKANLKSVVGKDVKLQENVDPDLIGGLIVKIGSRQIDTSLRTKLSSLKLSLKEVG